MSADSGRASRDRKHVGRRHGATTLSLRIAGCIVTLALAILVAPLAPAQPPSKSPRVGVLMPGSKSSFTNRAEAFRRGLRELGYVEGQNIVIEYRYVEGETDRIADFAGELVQLKVDVIVTASLPPVLAAKKASNTIPIVFVAVNDPVAAGLVASLARPGGNVTGLTNFSPDLDGKRLELLKEAFPHVGRVAYLWNPDAPGTGLSGMQTVATRFGLQLQSLDVRTPADFDGAFEAAVRGRAQALIALPSPLFIAHYKRILDFATKSSLPAMYPFRDFVRAGGLMSYTPSDQNWRRAASYVDKILKGAKPADLPVEQPTKFELVINMRTAKALGLTIPSSLLLRAEEIIE